MPGPVLPAQALAQGGGARVERGGDGHAGGNPKLGGWPPTPKQKDSRARRGGKQTRGGLAVGSETVSACQPAPLPQPVRTGIRHFHAGRWYEAHEAWEEHWLTLGGSRAGFYKGL
ncbi:MAG: DUF309 domain-containing protein, partial [Planctomycetota bacterium]